MTGNIVLLIAAFFPVVCAPLAWIGKSSLTYYAFETLTIPLSERLIRFAFPAVAAPSMPVLLAVVLLSSTIMAVISVFIHRTCPCILGKRTKP